MLASWINSIVFVALNIVIRQVDWWTSSIVLESKKIEDSSSSSGNPGEILRFPSLPFYYILNIFGLITIQFLEVSNSPARLPLLYVKYYRVSFFWRPPNSKRSPVEELSSHSFMKAKRTTIVYVLQIFGGGLLYRWRCFQTFSGQSVL